MPPTDQHLALPPGAHAIGGGTISLATLIDYIVQRTYHEMNVLSELLPRKTDMERKIEIVQFASRTRQLFIRLLALVKWANSASKVDKCGEIISILEQQSMLFVETADTLARMSRETLVNARLPNFSLPCAIDVLTLGTYPRLPTCIREKIVPPDPITPSEKKQTLQRLNQVIQYRLVSCELPTQMRKLDIENGRVKFVVEHEFRVTLTLMGDSPTIPWRLLDIEILVEDHETGDGKSLVHTLQIGYIHRLAQSRLLDNDKPLHDLYRVLHSFCQSLQLEVLHSQTQKLVRERLGDSLRVEDYTVGKCLVASYWRDQLKKDKTQDPIMYKLTIHVNDEDDGKPLCITHTPSMTPEECRRIGLTIQSDHLSVEKLLMQTIEVRTHAKLKELAMSIQRYVDGKCEVRDMPVALHIPTLYPCMPSEELRITIDSQRGTYLASLPSLELQVLYDLEDSLNGDRKGFEKFIMSLRLQLAMLRCEKSVQCLGCVAKRQIPVMNTSGHALEKLPKYKLFIQVPKQVNHHVIVTLEEKKPRGVETNYYLLETRACTGEGSEIDGPDEVSVKAFLKAGKLIELDTFSFTNGPYSVIFKEKEETELESFNRKRKLLLGEYVEPPAKKMKTSPYFVSELVHVVSACEERLPFVFLGDELKHQGACHTSIQVDSEGMCLMMNILSFPDAECCSKEDCDYVRRNLLSCKVRVISRPIRCWQVEYFLVNGPIQTTNSKESGFVQRAIFSYEMTSDNHAKVVREMINDWVAICNLYTVVRDFADSYNDVQTGFAGIVEIKSYNYKKLTLAYGGNGTSLVNIEWQKDAKQFHVSLGTQGQSSTINPHVAMATQLQQELNETRSLPHLVQILSDTWAPMLSLHKLSSAVILGVGTSPKQSTQSFTIIPQSTTHVRISFRSLNTIRVSSGLGPDQIRDSVSLDLGPNYLQMLSADNKSPLASYCLDIHFRANKIVAIRDGAYSLFNTSKVTEGFNPIPMLKAFLNMYIDDSVTGGNVRRRSATEDDNPPSPVDTMDVFNLSQQNPAGSGSPGSRARQDGGGARFHSPMTSPNPHTPASPGPRMSGVTPSPSTFIGTPSPGNILAAGSPGNPPLHVPSPGSFVPAPSPSSLGIHMQSPASSFISPQGVADSGSPYPSTNLAMPSPGQRNWPNSPSVQGPSPASRHAMVSSPGHPTLHSPQTQLKEEHAKAAVMSPPSRILPQRAWAAAIPTLLSHEAFDSLLSPSALQQLPIHVPLSPLERFLGCNFIRRHILRMITTEKHLTFLETREPGSHAFQADSLQYKITMNTSTLQSLHMKIQPLPECKDQWTPEEIQILEKYFDLKVACPPYKSNSLTSFGRLLKAPIRILKDCVQIMRLELVPNHDRSLKWSVQWLLTIPPLYAHIAPAGTPAVVVMAKMVLMLQLTRIGLQVPQEPQSITIPLLYDISNNHITLVEKDPSLPNPNLQQVMQMLKRFMDRYHQSQDCAIYPAVRELMTNLVLPIG